MSTRTGSVEARRVAIRQQQAEVRDKLGVIRDECEKLSTAETITDGQADRLSRQKAKLDELEAEGNRLRDAERELLMEAYQNGEAVGESGHTPSRQLDDDPIGDREKGDKLDIQRYGRPWGILGMWRRCDQRRHVSGEPGPCRLSRRPLGCRSVTGRQPPTF